METVFRGSTDYLKEIDKPQKSEAVEDLVERAMASADDDPLYVVAIGAITNVASAMLKMCIRDRSLSGYSYCPIRRYGSRALHRSIAYKTKNSRPFIRNSNHDWSILH